MVMNERLWAIVLAGGEGRRLGDLARDPSGAPAPKQFCHFGAERSLLASTLARAERLVPRERIVVSVLDAHRRWWGRELAGHSTDNVVSQPCSRGTAVGVLGPLLRIHRADAGARVVILPSDHAVEDETTLRRALEASTWAAERRPEDLVLLGFTPDEPDPTLGWIVPSRDQVGPTEAVLAFEEKPDHLRARRLMAAGALWNGMLIAARTSALARLYRRRLPELLRAGEALACPPGAGEGRGAATVFQTIPARDLSRDLLTPAVRRLRLVRVPPCGWTDLGTPARLFRWQAAQRARFHPTARSA